MLYLNPQSLFNCTLWPEQLPLSPIPKSLVTTAVSSALLHSHINGVIQYWSDFFHLPSWMSRTQGPSILSQMAGLRSFKWLTDISLDLRSASLSIYLLMDLYFVSVSWLLWIVLQWTWECRWLFKILYSLHLNIYTEMGLLGHMVVLLLIFRGTSIQFSIVATLDFHH